MFKTAALQGIPENLEELARYPNSASHSAADVPSSAPSSAYARNDTAQAMEERMRQLLKEVAVKDAELDSLRVLSRENALLRDQNNALRARLSTYEEERTRPVVDQTVLDLRVRLQAYQKHSTFLQNELLDREALVRGLKERIEILSEDVESKQQRCAVLVEKLKGAERTGATTFSLTGSRVGGGDALFIDDDPELFSTMREKLKRQGTEVSFLKESLANLQEDLQRKEMVLEAVQRENVTLRKSVSRLVDQVHANVVVRTAALPDSGPETSPPRAIMDNNASYRSGTDASWNGGYDGLNRSTFNVSASGNGGGGGGTLAAASRDNPTSRLKAYRMNKVMTEK